MAVNKVVYGGNTLIDLTSDTATASDVAQGKTFHLADGTQATGTASGGGGGSSYTLLHSEVVTVSTTSTSNANVKTIQLDRSKYTQDQMIYVRVRDTAGPRAGYFYGTDAFFIDAESINGSTLVSTISAHRCITVTSSSVYSVSNQAGATNYGVFGYSLTPYINTYNGGKIVIRRRYNSSASGTIDSDYRIDIFAIDSPDNLPFLEPLPDDEGGSGGGGGGSND